MAPPVMSKKDLVLALMSESLVKLQLDGRAEGVDLPEWLRQSPAVVLDIGLDLAVPIPDLVIDDDGVRATLSFRRTPHTCRIPWRAIYAIADANGRGALFGEDVPADVDLAAPAEAPPPPEPATPKAKKPRPSHLKLVD